MARYCITIVLLAVIPRFIAAKRQDLPFEKLKLPSQITVTGRMLCSKLPAYAVLINIVEKVRYKGSSGQEMSGKLRISRFSITGRDGAFKINGTRFVSADKLYLNITHHCIPLAKRKEYMNCFTTTLFTVRGDPKNIHFNIEEIALDQLTFQSEVFCRRWPYEYPEFLENYIASQEKAAKEKETREKTLSVKQDQ